METIFMQTFGGQIKSIMVFLKVAYSVFADQVILLLSIFLHLCLRVHVQNMVI